MIRLMIVDDHPIVREGLKMLLSDEEGFEVVAEAANGNEAIDYAKQLNPDVVLMDVMLPGQDGIQTTRQVRQVAKSQVIMLTSSLGDHLRVREAIKAGAVGYLLKDILKADLLQAIRQAAQGKTTLHPEAQAELLRHMTEDQPPHFDLTERELDVLKLIGQGKSNKKIASMLELTEGTVKGYVSTVLDKLNVGDRTQAALYAVEHKLIPKR